MFGDPAYRDDKGLGEDHCVFIKIVIPVMVILVSTSIDRHHHCHSRSHSCSCSRSSSRHRRRRGGGGGDGGDGGGGGGSGVGATTTTTTTTSSSTSTMMRRDPNWVHVRFLPYDSNNGPIVLRNPAKTRTFSPPLRGSASAPAPWDIRRKRCEKTRLRV